MVWSVGLEFSEKNSAIAHLLIVGNVLWLVRKRLSGHSENFPRMVNTAFSGWFRGLEKAFSDWKTNLLERFHGLDEEVSISY